ERRNHPGGDLPRGLGGARLPVGHTDVPDWSRADPARPRQLDHRRQRRRSDRRLVVRGRDLPVPGRPGDRADRDGGRDRRRRGGEGGSLRAGARVEAGARLHRGVLRADREDDGARGGDHLRLLGDRAGQEGSARGLRDRGRDDSDRGRAHGRRADALADGALAAWIGLGLSFVSALVVNWAYTREHAAASTLPPLSPRHPLAAARLLLRARMWLVGFASETAGWIVYVVSLALA